MYVIKKPLPGCIICHLFCATKKCVSQPPPQFFILYVNDKCYVVKYSKMLMYADDLMLYREVNDVWDASFLQYNLQAISD